MRVTIQCSSREEAKALPILLRHSPGMVLRNRVYVLSEEAVHVLREAGVQFTEVASEVDAPVWKEPAPVREYDSYARSHIMTAYPSKCASFSLCTTSW